MIILNIFEIKRFSNHEIKICDFNNDDHHRQYKVNDFLGLDIKGFLNIINHGIKISLIEIKLCYNKL